MDLHNKCSRYNEKNKLDNSINNRMKRRLGEKNINNIIKPHNNDNNLKILKIYPKMDNIRRYNYHVNYGVWDEINGDSIILENLDMKLLNKYDLVFLPMYKRWKEHMKQFNRIKEHKIKTILFDNDSQYRSFSDDFYSGIDYIFYRNKDKDNNIPNINSSWLMWSVNTNKYIPKYGGKDISFNCTIHPIYPFRVEISKFLKNTNYNGDRYIKHLQDSAAAIHTSSINMAHAKIVEFAACGTQIISNRTDYLNKYFPDNLITYFNDIDELKDIVKNYKTNINIQKQLRHIVKTKHDNKIRATEVLKKIKEIL